MEFKIYEALLDPVIVVDDGAKVHYVNRSALRWLAVPPKEAVIGRNLEELVSFPDAQIYSSFDSLRDWECAPYWLTDFNLKANGYVSRARVSMQCLPMPELKKQFSIIVRDIVYAQTLQDEEDIKFRALDEIEAKMVGQQTAAPKITPKPSSKSAHLDESDDKTAKLSNSKVTTLPNRVTAHFLTKALVVVPSLKLNLKGQTLKITHESIEMMVQNGEIPVGTKCSLEIFGNLDLTSFTSLSTVEHLATERDGFYVISFRFDNLSPLLTKKIAGYIEKFGIKK